MKTKLLFLTAVVAALVFNVKAQIIIFSENFNATGTGAIPAGWLDTNGTACSPDPLWAAGIVSGYSINGTKACNSYAPSSCSGSQIELITPAIDLSSATNPVLDFDQILDVSGTTDGTGYLFVYDGANWQMLTSFNSGLGSDMSPNHQTISLNAYTGNANFYIDFVFYTANGGTWTWALDNIVITGTGTPSAPVADFTANVTTVSVGGSVNFTDLSTNTPTQWAWTFNGGTPSSSSAQSPSGIVYNTAGTYSVSLTATNSGGSDNETKTSYITVTSTLSYCTPTYTTGTTDGDYTDGVVLGSINNQSTGSSGGPNYNDYTFMTTNLAQSSSNTLSITSGAYSTDDYAAWIDYNKDGVFSSSEKLGQVSCTSAFQTMTINFTVSGTAPTGSTRLRVRCAYNTSGAMDPCSSYGYGETEDYSVNITSSGTSAPVADFTANVTTVSVGGSVNFTDLSTNTPTQWAWTFNGGTPSSSTIKNPSGIIYNTAGTYSVSLTATNSGGSNTNTKTSYITVTSGTVPPVADFTANVTTVSVGGSVNFTDLSTNTPTQWAWTFTGGAPSSSTIKNPSNIVYNSVGTYSVSLTATNSGGSNTNTKTSYITVTSGGSAPVADFSETPATINVGQTIRFDDLSTNAPTSWSWTFTGGTPASSSSQFPPNIVYNTAGTYNVTLNVSNGGGSNNKTKSVTVNNNSFGSCDTTYNKQSGDSLASGANYFSSNFQTWGYYPGTNDDYNKYAEKFTNPLGGGSLSNFIVNITKSVQIIPGDMVTFNVYDDIGGLPGNILGGKSVLYSSLIPGLNTVTLNQPVTVGGSFFISLETDYQSQDTIEMRMNHNSANTARINTSYVYDWSGWVAANSIPYLSGLGSTSYAIKSIVCQAIDFTSNAQVLNVGTGTNFTDLSSTSSSWSWTFNGGTPSSSTVKNPANIVYNTVGTYTVSLTNAWGTKTKTNYMIVVDPCSSDSTLIGTTPTMNNLPNDNYHLIVTDAIGCKNIGAMTITTNNSLYANANIQTYNQCNTTNSGAATCSPGGGSSPYTYLWSTGQNTQTINNLVNGNYTVTITDAIGCKNTGTVTITTNNNLYVNAYTQTYNQCNTTNAGAATCSASGGTPSYTYLWSNGQNTQTINNLTNGNYTVTITDAVGCTSTGTVVIATSNNNLYANSGVQSSNQCNTTNAGSATCSPFGGTPSYTYQWSTGQNMQTINNLTNGNYTVTVTDAIGCTETETVVIATSNNLYANSGVQNSNQCNTTNSGSAMCSPFGGTPSYTYQWSTGQNTQTINNLTNGNYTVTVTDAIGCTNIETVVITTTNNLYVNAYAQTNNQCNTTNSGVATCTANGTPSYTYLWSNGQTSPTINNLTNGNYTVTVTDAIGCTSTGTAVIYTNNNLYVSAYSQNNNQCNTINAGTATSNAGGGTSPYTYQWYVVGPTKPVITQSCQTLTCSNVSATSYQWKLNGTNISGATGQTYIPAATGNYEVFVTYANNCSATSAALMVNSFPDATVFPSGPTTFCMGGSVTLTVSPNSSYNWSNGATTQSITISSSGSYYVTIIDANGCYAVSSPTTVTVTTVPTAVITANGSTSFCQGGSVTLSGNQGTAYSWSSGQTTQSITVTQSGNYTVTITNAGGCTGNATTSATVTVTANPATPTITANGSTLTSSSATGNQWYLNGNAIPGATSQNYTVTQNGNYSVTVTANGCSSPSAVYAVGVEEISANNSVFIFPNPNNGNFTVSQNGNVQSISITVLNVLGEKIFETRTAASKTDINLSNQSNGIYFIQVKTKDKISNHKIIIQ